MLPRKRLDIRGRDLIYGFMFCARTPDAAQTTANLERAWTHTRHGFACLSVRTAWDLIMQAMTWPQGSEVIMSAITIPHMAQIVRHHGYVPVSVDIDVRTCQTPADAVAHAIGPKTRAIIVTQLFGTRAGLSPLRALADDHNLLLVEDCAQGFMGQDHEGDPMADVTMHSFGTIKFATAMGGALCAIKDEALCDRVRALHSEYPLQTAQTHRGKLLKNTALFLMSYPSIYGAFVGVLDGLGKDHNVTVRAWSRGFSDSSLFEHIRQRPDAALLALLAHRLRTYPTASLSHREAQTRRLTDLMRPELTFFGIDASPHTFWLLPLLVDNPDEVIAYMKRHGVDATTASSTLIAIDRDARAQEVGSNAWAMEHVVYVPVPFYVADAAVKKIAQHLNHVACPLAKA